MGLLISATPRIWALQTRFETKVILTTGSTIILTSIQSFSWYVYITMTLGNSSDPSWIAEKVFICNHTLMPSDCREPGQIPTQTVLGT
ncbi:hypothetical protein HBH98_256090 [Parastagonospora nodorum]|nr:hypothetical protein HBH53_264580 [Parastagonospora nodorum]KAH3955968.1 hypothetical protein HBH51_259330 [Parastagonospora nodorum]KAH4215247.1 hypothetical protein HBI06_258480 [Parastagonospora nodorum]KAH4219198.1 hypothetical protein HBI05_257060 [Parastagonospora nodorum]KAH4330490.1 hypothetical protein HBH98_256090 [Parastagonospora nodorum]